MQKLLQRTAQARRQAARKLAKGKAHRAHEEREIWRLERSRIAAAHGDLIRKARQRRREAWECGPLAPRYDVGKERDTWGTIPDVLNNAVPPKHKPQIWIEEGDRVAILEGSDKGKIGIVKSVNEDTHSVIIRGLNLAAASIPEYIRKSVSDYANTPYTVRELPLPISSIRLVAVVPDAITKVPRDVIVEDVKLVKTLDPDRPASAHQYDRMIPGLNIRIPWPIRDVEVFPDNDDDTVRVFTEEATFKPELNVEPFPASVLDELRNPYSRFRHRHTDEFIEAKKAEDRGAKFVESTVVLMQTPLEQAARARAEERRRLREENRIPEATVMEKIGEFIAKKRGLAPPAEGAAEGTEAATVS